VLGALGFGKHDVQPPAAVEAIRWLGSVVPSALLVLSAWFARGYPLTRAEHARILTRLAERGDQAKLATSASSISARTAG
jgi:Na+/melibiose symporter-like transporter